MVVAWLARLQANLPIIPLRLDQQDVCVNGVGGIQHVIEVKKEMLSSLGAPVSVQTLYQALDAYSAYVGEKYRDKPNKRPLQRTIALLRKQAEDHTLEKLDADKIRSQSIGRPISERGCATKLQTERRSDPERHGI